MLGFPFCRRAGTELLPECLEEWSIAGGDVKPSTYENFDRVGKLPVEAPYQLLEARKHAHVWYHSVELSQSKGNVGLLSVRLGTKSLGARARKERVGGQCYCVGRVSGTPGLWWELETGYLLRVICGMGINVQNTYIRTCIFPG